MSEYHGPVSHSENMRMQRESDEREAWEEACKVHESKGILVRLATSPSDYYRKPNRTYDGFFE